MTLNVVSKAGFLDSGSAAPERSRYCLFLVQLHIFSNGNVLIKSQNEVSCFSRELIEPLIRDGSGKGWKLETILNILIVGETEIEVTFLRGVKVNFIAVDGGLKAV